MNLEAECIKSWGIALTGGIATGKSFISSLLREKGFPVFDADIFSREVCQPGEPAYTKIIDFFGREILDDSLFINRKKLASLVFGDPKKLLRLESIVHPQIELRLIARLREEGLFERPRVWFYEASLIFERGREKDFKEVWLTHCLRETQEKRLRERNSGFSKEFIKKLLSSQQPYESKKEKADYLIDMEGSKLEIEKEIFSKVNEFSLFS